MNKIYTMSKFKTLEIHATNPYPIEGIKNKIHTLREDEQEMVDPNTGEFYLMRRMPKNKEILHDTYTYTKLFRESPVKPKNFSVPAFNLFYYIASNMGIKRDYICIDEDVFLNEF